MCRTSGWHSATARPQIRAVIGAAGRVQRWNRLGVDQAAGVARAILGVAGDGVVRDLPPARPSTAGCGRPAISDVPCRRPGRASRQASERRLGPTARGTAKATGLPSRRDDDRGPPVQSRGAPADRRTSRYGEWFPADHAWDPRRAHLAVELTQVLAAYAVPWRVPPPGNLFHPVPRADLCALRPRCLFPRLRADLTGDARNVLLTLVRIWYTAETAACSLKTRQAAWAVRSPAWRWRAFLPTRAPCI